MLQRYSWICQSASLLQFVCSVYFEGDSETRTVVLCLGAVSSVIIFFFCPYFALQSFWMKRLHGWHAWFRRSSDESRRERAPPREGTTLHHGSATNGCLIVVLRDVAAPTHSISHTVEHARRGPAFLEELVFFFLYRQCSHFQGNRQIKQREGTQFQLRFFIFRKRMLARSQAP